MASPHGIGERLNNGSEYLLAFHTGPGVHRLDAETHARIQAVIRSHFARSTIIMIAHRLDSLVDFDRVAVLEGGKVVEYDSPTTLLADSNSAFARLYRGEGRDL